MTIKDKIEYVKNHIDEAIETSPISPVHTYLYPLTEYEDGPTILSRDEQKSIVKKLEDDGYIKDVVYDDDGVGLWFEKVASKTRRSSLMSYIKTTDEFLQRRELFEKFLQIVDIRNIKPDHIYKIPTEEKNDDLIQLLIDLKVVQYDWKDMEKQAHRIVGNRIIEFQVNGNDILKLYGRVSGKNAHIKKQALELISKDIGDRFTLNKIISLFTDFGVPESMFIEDTKWRAVFYILSYYTSSERQEDYFFALKLIQETLHPLMFEGDEKSIQATRDKYKKWLKYDGIDIGDDGKLYIAPSEEELELGMDDWVSIDGDVVEPKSYLISQDHISELWVLLSQLIMLVQTYQNNFSADKKELEKLYLEVIGKIERLIETGDVGKLRENYQRPFTSLSTADVETQAKKADNPLSLVTNILLEVTSLNPNPEEIAKQLEENASLIERITSATRAITGDNIDYQKISYEQATFLLKLIFGRIFNILEAISTGYIHMTDERLNARYIILSDNLNGLLERPDMETLQKSLPEIPKHLFEWIDEVDVWWENGGKSSLMAFYGDIEAMWVRTAQQTFPLPQWFAVFLTEVDNSITEHKKTKSAHWSRIIKNVDEENKRNSSNSGLDNKPQQPQEPLHIIIDEVKKEVPIKGFEERVVLQKPKNKKIQLRKFPDGLKWQEVSIKFLNGQEVIVSAKDDTFQTDYLQMGFEDVKKKQPNLQWSFLKLLATKNGELSWDNNNNMTQQQINSAKKQKQSLAEALKAYFQIKEDPFENYRTTKAYKIKINLIPEDNTSNQSGEITEDY